MWGLYALYKWNTRIFQDKTLLAPMDYTRVQDPNHIFKVTCIHSDGSWT